MRCELVSKTVGVGRYKDLNNEEIIAAVARHGTIKEDNGKLVKYLMDNKHYSPLQHIFFSFRIVTSRAMSAQIFRHRSLNFQETSQRYEKIVEIEPIELRKQATKNRQSSSSIVYDDPMEGFNPNARVKHALSLVNTVYEELLKWNVAKESTRMILPMASQTIIHVSGTFRDLLAFLNIRCDEHSQKEVRDIANAMGEELEKEMPEIMKAIDWRKGLFL